MPKTPGQLDRDRALSRFILERTRQEWAEYDAALTALDADDGGPQSATLLARYEAAERVLRRAEDAAADAWADANPPD